jgi:hypothetical protein
VEHAAKYARPLRTQNPEPKPSTCSKKTESADEKSYRRSHSGIDCERQSDANGVREEAKRGSGSEVNAKTRPLSDRERSESCRRACNSGLWEYCGKIVLISRNVNLHVIVA